MADLKTHPTDVSALDFVNAVENERRKADALVLLEMYKRITGQEPVMWGPSIIGYGTYTYTLANGKRNRFMRSGFSPRKQNMTVYVGAGIAENPQILERLGKHKTSKACLYVNKLDDVDLSVLEELIRADLAVMDKRYPD